MKVVRSKVIGYCFGVSNTIENAKACLEKANEKHCPCYSIGNLIHNEDVVERFRRKGLVTIKSPEGNEKGIALVRAHGIPDKDRRAFLDAGFEIVDSTCPIVAKGANTLRRASKKGKRTIVMGVAGHAETLGLMGVETEPGVTVPSVLICNEEDAHSLIASNSIGKDESIVVVTQTTFKVADYNRIRKLLKEHFSDISFSNSPCGASSTRVSAVIELAQNTDAIVVVGGKHSENTKGLAIAAAKVGKPVYQILNEKDMDAAMKNELSGFQSIGICSGSSTPTYVIKAVEDVIAALDSKETT